MDAALWESPRASDLAPGDLQLVATLPFDHTRRAASALLGEGDQRVLVVKGAPEQVMAKCVAVPDSAGPTLAELFAGGRRVVAVASKAAPELSTIVADDESGLTLDGFDLR
jgi:Mg2+-importing ATPase